MAWSLIESVYRIRFYLNFLSQRSSGIKGGQGRREEAAGKMSLDWQGFTQEHSRGT